MEKYTDIQIKAYRKYQLDWMLRNNCSLSCLQEILTDLAKKEFEENPEDIPVNTSMLIPFADKLSSRFLEDGGFNGSVFSTIDQFLKKEYQEVFYVSHLLTRTEFNEYLNETIIKKQDKKQIVLTEPKIEGITLLSTQEAEKLPVKIRRCTDKGAPCWWWLRTPGGDRNRVSRVYGDGDISYRGCFVNDSDVAVRPVLKISNLNSVSIKEYEIIRIFDLNWIVISVDTVLSQEAVGYTVFREEYTAPDANDYEKSDIKKYLENWLEKQLANNK